MNEIKDQLATINKLIKENDTVYRNLALQRGLSDCAFWILYILNSEPESISQSELSNEWFYSKQTVNSAISHLQKRGFVTLQTIPGTRNRKNILLTEEGRVYADEVVVEVSDIECTAFAHLDEEERRTLVALLEKSVRYTREEYEKRQQIKSEKQECNKPPCP